LKNKFYNVLEKLKTPEKHSKMTERYQQWSQSIDMTLY